MSMNRICSSRFRHFFYDERLGLEIKDLNANQYAAKMIKHYLDYIDNHRGYRKKESNQFINKIFRLFDQNINDVTDLFIKDINSEEII